MATKTIDQTIAKISRSALNTLENERKHREFKRQKAIEASRREVEAANELRLMELDEAKREIIARIDTFNKFGSIGNDFESVFAQTHSLVPQKFDEVETVEAVFESIKTVFFVNYDPFKPGYEKLLAEAKAVITGRIEAELQLETEDTDYFNRCIDEIVRLFKEKDQTVKRYFDLIAHLKTGILVPRHRGIDGFRIIVSAIKTQMPGFAEAWAQKIEQGLANAEEREAAFQAKKAQKR